MPAPGKGIGGGLRADHALQPRPVGREVVGEGHRRIGIALAHHHRPFVALDRGAAFAERREIDRARRRPTGCASSRAPIPRRSSPTASPRVAIGAAAAMKVSGSEWRTTCMRDVGTARRATILTHSTHSIREEPCRTLNPSAGTPGTSRRRSTCPAPTAAGTRSRRCAARTAPSSCSSATTARTSRRSLDKIVRDMRELAAARRGQRRDHEQRSRRTIPTIRSTT